MPRFRLAHLVLAVWVVLWLLFLARPLIKDHLLGQYTALVRASSEERRSIAIGKELFEFIRFCEASVPQASKYSVVGLEPVSLEGRYITYYLYPRVPAASPDFLVVYKVSNFSKDGYRLYQSLGPDKYILTKV